MATTIAVACPKCEKQIKAPPDLVGKKIRCKECRHVFLVEAPKAAKAKEDPSAKPAKPSKAAHDPRYDRDDNPYDVTDHEFLPRCPYCAKELEEDGQVICLHCGYNMRTRERVKPKKIYDQSGGEKFTWLLPGILCAVAVLLMIGAIVTTWIVFPRLEKDGSEAWWTVFFSLAFRLWESIIYLFVAFFTGKFAIKRLIFHPTPPEKEKHK